MVFSQHPIIYDYKSFTLNSGETDYDVKSNISALWDNIVTARSMILKTSKNITMKINSTLMPEFPVNIGDTPWQFPENYILISNLYLSNSSGENSTVQIWLF